MAHYRIYLLDDSVKIFHGEDVEAPDDAAAIAAGWQMLETHNLGSSAMAHGIEVWAGRSRIF
jgi:hypothetical protein